MKLIGKIVKYTGYFGIYLITLIESYLTGLLFISSVMTIVFAVWSFIRPLPQYVAQHYGVLYLQSAIPVGIVVFIYLVTSVRKKK